MRRLLTMSMQGGLIAAMLALVPFVASAHERREVADGQFVFVVGFLDEPAYAGEKNGLSLRVSQVDPAATPAADGEESAGVPVEGLETTLQAEVFFIDQMMALPISASFGDPGHYESVFFPTQAGDYSFHIFGTIDGVAIDETFTSGPQTFGPMEDPTPLLFPKPASASASDGVAAGISGPIGGGDDDLTGSRWLLAVGGVGMAGLWAMRRVATSRRLSAQAV